MGGGKKINIKEICNHGAFNCKYGVHNDSFLICRDDFLTGKCKCKSIEFVKERKNELEELLNSKDDEFVTKRSKNVTRKLREEYEMLNNYQRNVHFTDDPEFVPFNVKLKEYHKKQELLRKEKEMADKVKKEKEKSRQEHLSTASIKQKRVMKPSFKK